MLSFLRFYSLFYYYLCATLWCGDWSFIAAQEWGHLKRMDGLITFTENAKSLHSNKDVWTGDSFQYPFHEGLPAGFFFLYPPLSYFLSRSLVLWCYFPPLRFSSSLLQDFSPLLAPPAVYKIQSQFSNQKTHCLPIGLRCNLKLHSWIPPPVSSLYSVPSIQIFYISRDITRPYFS